MYSYLFNVSCIWLISLSVYGIFIHRKVPHTHSRVYLLLTLLAALIIPCIPLHSIPADAYNNAAISPLLFDKATHIQQLPAVTQSGSLYASGVLTTIYVAGVLISFMHIAVDSMKIWHLYKNGKRHTSNGWTIIETNIAHTPFSFSHLLFVRDISDYDTNEWGMLLIHEREHQKRKHLWDILLIQLLGILLWFHPLVYVYRYYIRLLHEYQADAAATDTNIWYSAFLIQQLMLTPAPRISLALGSSSVKSRLTMLHSSYKKSPIRVFLTIPLLLLFTLCFAADKDGIPIKNGNVCKYKGNTIKFQPPQLPDSYMRRDEKTGRLVRTPIGWPTPPVRINEDSIYNSIHTKELVPSSATQRSNGVIAYLINNGNNTFSQLPDGDYSFILTSIVTDAHGLLVYFENHGIILIGKGTFPGAEAYKATINKMLVAAPAFTPAYLNGIAVAALVEHPNLFAGATTEKDFTVHNHKITWAITQ